MGARGRYDLPPVAPYTTGMVSSNGAAAESAALRLVSPADGIVLSISRNLPLSSQALPIEVQPSVLVSYVEVLIDGRAVARLDRAPYRYVWQLQPGSFEIAARAVDPAGAELHTRSARVQVLGP